MAEILTAQTPASHFVVVTSDNGIQPTFITVPRQLPKRRLYVLADGVGANVSGQIQFLNNLQVVYELPYRYINGATMLVVCGGFGTYDSNTVNALFADFPVGGAVAVAPWETTVVCDKIQFSGSSSGVTSWILACHSQSLI